MSAYCERCAAVAHLPCPFCDREIAVTRVRGQEAIVHAEPPCQRFCGEDQARDDLSSQTFGSVVEIVMRYAEA